jgi:ribonuclease VapC
VSRVVLDASALIAFIKNEPGGDRVHAVLGEAAISAVNFSEVIAKMTDFGREVTEVERQLHRLQLEILAFTSEDARIAAAFRRPTRAAGLSLGDRSCLALGKRLGFPVLTADRQWSDLPVDVKIELIR